MLLERVPSYLISPTPGDRADTVSAKIGSHYFEFDLDAARRFMVDLGHAIHEREALDSTVGDDDSFQI